MKLSDVLKKAEVLATALLREKPNNSLSFPQKAGVYLIYNKERRILYVGKAKNIQRRICIDHLSGELKDTMSAFRRTLHSDYHIPFGKKMKEWIKDNCLFSYLEIPDADMRSLVEALIIAHLRNGSLLNKS